MTTVARATLSQDELVDAIRSDIATGDLAPGARLVEASLLDRYGVGRTAVRVALARLEQDGLVVKEPNKGVSVRVVTEDEAVEITKIRQALEGVAAAEAAQRATDEDVENLRTMIRAMRADLEEGDLYRYSTRNAMLHDAVLDIAGSDRIARMVRSLKVQSVKFQFRTVMAPGRSAKSVEEHSEIVEAIAAHDPERAERAIKTHLGHIIEALHRTR